MNIIVLVYDTKRSYWCAYLKHRPEARMYGITQDEAIGKLVRVYGDTFRVKVECE